MKKSVLISFAIGALLALATLVFLVFHGQRPVSDKDVPAEAGNFNAYDEEAERRAEALSDSGIVSAEIVASTGATQVMNPDMPPIPDATGEREIPTGKLQEE